MSPTLARLHCTRAYLYWLVCLLGLTTYHKFQSSWKLTVHSNVLLMLQLSLAWKRLGVKTTQLECIRSMHGNLLPRLWVWQPFDKAGCKSQTAGCTVVRFASGKTTLSCTSVSAPLPTPFQLLSITVIMFMHRSFPHMLESRASAFNSVQVRVASCISSLDSTCFDMFTCKRMVIVSILCFFVLCFDCYLSCWCVTCMHSSRGFQGPETEVQLGMA